MKGFVGTVVIVGCIVGVVMWALLARYQADLRAVRGIDPCALDEVACASTPSGLVHHATFSAAGRPGGSPSANLSVSCVGSLWDVGIAFGKPLPPGRYNVGWESFVIPSPPPGAGGWSASDGFLSSPEPGAFVEAALGPVPLPGEVALAALDVDPPLVFNVTRAPEFEASFAFDALRVRAVVRAIAVGCGRGEPADG
ncbi:MAG: hypothetical protein OXH75_10625 [Acidobacteria bacterium]|nr:hypothetical protein [Acidobacteriota bacterium]